MITQARDLRARIHSGTVPEDARKLLADLSKQHAEQQRLDSPQRFGAGHPVWLPDSPFSKPALGRPSVFRPHREAAITVMATDHEAC